MSSPMAAFADHEALLGLNTEQVAELALYGLRYRALGATDIDFSEPEMLEPYWTGERMVKDAVKKALKAVRARAPLAELRVSEAVGHLLALFNCGVIDWATYNAQFHLILDRHKRKVS